MTTVYVVTSGEYSDYGIRGIFSTKEKAQRWIGDSPHYFIEEWELDKTFRGDRLYFKAIFESDGSICEVLPVEEHYNLPEGEEVTLGSFWEGDGLIFLAQDIKHARKHAPEIMAQFIAEGKVTLK